MKVRSVTTGIVFDWPDDTCEALVLNGSVEPVEDDQPRAKKAPAKKAAPKPPAK